MSDSHSFQLLFDQFSLAEQKSIWVLDENPPENCPPPNKHIEVITNRYDVAQQMRKLGYDATFSDFEFNKLSPHSFHNIFYRISKEKMLAHHIINKANDLLIEQGNLIITGAKQEGIKGYIDRTAKRYIKVNTLKADKQNWGGVFQNTLHSTATLEDKDYPSLREIELKQPEQELVFHSKPGVFGWNKVDQGSKLLIEHLKSLLLSHQLTKVDHVLDIGCGYGYLSLHCAKLMDCQITACDNNAAAINACQFNLNSHSIKNQVIATNCTESVTEKFNLILCNPPFHSGFSIENNLTDRFLKGASQCLNDTGVALFVVNLHIPLERKAADYFKYVTTLSDDKHFKVIALSHSKVI